MSNPRADIFAAVKARVPNVWNDIGNIAAMDNLLDAFGVPREGTELRTSQAGIDLIHSFESYRATTYPDPGTGGKPYTGGWGTTRDIKGQPFALGVTHSQEYWDGLFARDLAQFEREVRAAIGGAPTTQAQFDALVSFHYNTGAIGRATLTKLHKAGKYDDAQAEFGKWVMAGGKRMAGLVRRRAAEAKLYGGGR